jgi:hypothetical protein
MPKKQTKNSAEKRIPGARENQSLEDWIAPVVAFVAVSTMLFAILQWPGNI